MKSRQYVSIQCLRACAALLIVVFHVGGIVGAFSTDRDPNQVYWPEAGVDIFFVISGFVMIVSTEGRRITGWGFLEARLSRIVPLYWTITLLYIALFPMMSRASPAVGDVIKSLLFIFYQNPIYDQPVPILRPGWSLNYEVFFYILFAATIAIAPLRRIALLALIFAALVALRKFTPEGNGFLLRLTSPLPFEFVAGMLLGHFRGRLAAAPPVAGLLLLCAGLACLPLIHVRLPRFMLYGSLSTMIVAGGIIAEPLFQQASLKWLTVLGDASYSLYLVHPVILVTLTYFGILRPGLASGAFAVALCVALSVPIYFYYERTITNATKRLLQLRRSKAAVFEVTPP